MDAGDRPALGRGRPRRRCLESGSGTSATQQLESFKRDAGTDGTWASTRNPGCTSAAHRSLNWSPVPTMLHAGAAHPLLSTGTVVIDSRSAKPITLADLFTDEDAA